jgi:hypothetical protein
MNAGGAFGHWTQALGFLSSDAHPPIVPAVGVVDTGRTRLLRFEGLQEGFAQIA